MKLVALILRTAPREVSIFRRTGPGPFRSMGPLGPSGPTHFSCRESPTVEGRDQGVRQDVSQSRDISDDGHGLPAAGCVWKLSPNCPSPSGVTRATGDALVHADGQVPPSARPTRGHGRRGRESTTPVVGGVRGRTSPGSLVGRHKTSSQAASAAGRSSARLQRIAGEGPAEGWARSRFQAARNASFAVRSCPWSGSCPSADPLKDAEEHSTWFTHEACFGV